MDEPIAAVDGVKNNQIMCTVRLDARGTDIEGTLCKIETDSQSILGRIGRIDLTNQMHDDMSFKTLIMANGELPYFSKYADIEQTAIEIVTCIDKATGRIAPKKSNPASGTQVYSVSNEDMQIFVPEKEFMMYIGNLPNDASVQMSVINKHYGADDDGDGWGEAKHRGYFGKNGSGKTVQALTHLAGRLVAYPQLGVLIPDTAGDISQADRHSKANYQFSFLELLDRGGRQARTVEIGDVRLESRNTLETLYMAFLKKLKIGADENLSTLSNRVITSQFQKTVDIDSISLDDLLEATAAQAPLCWSGRTGDQKAGVIRSLIGQDYTNEQYESMVRKFFVGHHTVKSIIDNVLMNGEIILLQLHSMSRSDQEFVIYEIFRNITWQTESAFKRKGDTVNAEIVLDEAPRWVKQGSKERIPQLIKDAAKTTRKYGLSWTFIGQRLAGVDNEVLSQLHTKWFGKGLGTGADATHMREALGNAGIEAYEKLSSQGGYFWLGVGDEVNLGVGTSHISVMSYGGDATNTLIRANPHIWR